MTQPVFIVTGASKGIGLAVVVALVSRLGSCVVGTGRTPATDLPAQLRALPSTQFVYVAGDCTDSGLHQQLVQTALDRWARLDGLVLNAGILEPIQRIAEADLSQWRRLMDINFFSVVELTQRCLTHLRASKGRIVLVSSGAAVNAYTGWAPYCTSKAAMNMFSRGLAIEEPDIVTVALRPGVVDTGMQSLIRSDGLAGMTSEQHSKFVQLKEDGNLLPPEKPGLAIALLVRYGEASLSGEFVNWDDARVAAYTAHAE
ncbi:short-chain dehydrogenase [Polychytrium aggregatum]|uniref:short-chain dehydrogenase n=1 Tax=Polychytrium aggregatum TaxID=110093 RepID=UPI0022FE188B|nr:short-chain dehydrogenase [Polychytrium aggregatum]KAI9201819.1 short-chain dehydrogenase [Polychytrium aggregatum]